MAQHYSKRTILAANGCLSMIFIVLLVISLTLTITSVITLFYPETQKNTDTAKTLDMSDTANSSVLTQTVPLNEALDEKSHETITTEKTEDGNIVAGIIATIIMAGLSWLWFKGLQFVRKNKKKDLEKFRMLRDTVGPDTITRKHMFHAREYFNSANEITGLIIGLGEALSGLPEFMEIFDQSGACNRLPATMSGRDAVLYKIQTDLIRCYLKLGYHPDFKKKEGLPLALLALKSKKDAPKINARNYKKVVESNRKDLETSLALAIDEARTFPDFSILYLLSQFNRELKGRYRIFLYRFTSIVAKADRAISPDETNFLQYLADFNLTGNETYQSPTACKTKISEEKAIVQLERLIGLNHVKSEIATLANYIQVQKLRAEKGLKVSPVSYHCVFTGNPGTGKTTVARIVAGIYRDLGVLKKGHLVETDRSGLIAEYVGHTAIKTNKLIDSALDGVLFIDEAYSLVDGGSCDYGKEAIATLLKRMEDNRDRLVVIIAGYTEDMKRFIHSNPGLESRFNRYIEFPDYSVEELTQIFESQAQRYEYLLDEGARTALQEVLCTAVANKDTHFGNGRFVRNLFEKVVACQANRVAAEPAVSAETLATIRAGDIQSAVKA